MSKHTPAPWKMYKTPNDADFVAEIEGIASVYAASGDALANARLIAAAPELLQALRGLDEAYCRAGSPLSKDERHEDRLRLIAARAAIAKATGAD